MTLLDPRPSRVPRVRALGVLVALALLSACAPAVQSPERGQAGVVIAPPEDRTAPAIGASGPPDAPLGAPLAAPPVTVAGGALVAAERPPLAQTLAVETVVGGLEVPWALAWAADGRLFLTERAGRLRAVAPDGTLQPEPLAVLPVSRGTSEGGLLGLALAPDFSQSGALYVYYTYDAADGVRNRISRLRLVGGRATDEAIVFDGIAGAAVHDGGAIAFGPDGKLYVGTGDARRPPLAANPASPNGKILRLNPDGSIPDDNPVAGSPVYSRGHRNVQALTWQPGTGQLYAAEHGPSGENGWCCHDET